MARWGRTRGLLLSAGGDLALGHHRVAVDTADHPVGVVRKYGGHSVYYQRVSFALHQHTPVAGGVAPAAMAPRSTGRTRVVLWVLFDAVVVEHGSEIAGIRRICRTRKNAFAFLRDEDYSAEQSDGW